VKQQWNEQFRVSKDSKSKKERGPRLGHMSSSQLLLITSPLETSRVIVKATLPSKVPRGKWHHPSLCKRQLQVDGKAIQRVVDEGLMEEIRILNARLVAVEA